MSIESECVDVTLMAIDPRKVIESPDGYTIIPKAEKLVDVCLNGNFLANAIREQRNCEMQGEPFVIRLLPDEENPLEPPLFATAILSGPCQFNAFVTGGPN